MDISSYREQYDKAQILPDKLEIVKTRVDEILKNKNLYKVIEGQTRIPWDIIACIHSLESDLSLKRHLHNGDPLTSKTVNTPKGRPKNGKPPFTWVESAIDALGAYPRPLLWDLDVKLYFIESYNGLGYRRLKINSPYLWSFTDQYTKGKFILDGHFDPEAVSQQIGAVPLLKIIANLS